MPARPGPSIRECPRAARPRLRAATAAAAILLPALTSCHRLSPVTTGPQDGEAPPGIAVTTAFHKRFVPDRWTCVAFDVTSESDSGQKLRLGVTFEDDAGRQATTLFDADVPPDSRKIFRLPVRPHTPKLRVWREMRGSGRKDIAEIDLVSIAGDFYESTPPAVTLVLGAEAGPPGRAAAGSGNILLGTDQAAFPDKWYCLETISTIAAGAGAVAQLDVWQKKALADWVMAGGRLVLSVEPAISTLCGGPMAAIVPEGMHDAGGILPDATVQRVLRERPGEVIARRDGHATALEASFGLGSAVFLADSLASSGCLLPAGGRQAELILAAREGGISCGSMNDAGVCDQWTEMTSRPIPAALVFGLLAAYLIIIGPLDYFVLRLLKRLELTWYTFFLVSVLVSAAVLYWVYKARGGVFTATTRVAVMTARDGVSRSVAVSALDFQAAAFYSFAAEDDSSVLWSLGAARERSMGGMLASSRYDIRADKGFKLDAYYVPIWTRQVMRTDSVEEPAAHAGRDAASLPGLSGAGILRHQWDINIGNLFGTRATNSAAVSGSRVGELVPRVTAFTREMASLRPEDHEFVIHALVEYLSLRRTDAHAGGWIMVKEIDAGYLPFSMRGGLPVKKCVVYAISEFNPDAGGIQGERTHE